MSTLYDYPEEIREKFMEINEACKILGVHYDTVKQLIEEGRLPVERNPYNGLMMLLREGVEEYARLFQRESARKVAKCESCGVIFEKVEARQDERGVYYLDGNKCRACRMQGNNVVVVRRQSKYVPHEGGQHLIHQSKARYRIINSGTRWGKDRCSINEFISKFADMLSEDRGSDLIPRVHGWIVGPNLGLTRQSWRELKEFFPEDWIVRIYEGDRVISTVNGGIIEVKSADDPNALVSAGLDIVLITEAARIKDLEDVWSFLYSRVQSPGRGPNGTGGLILANSTPRGKGYWYELVRMGRKDDPNYDPEFETFEFPTESNPYFLKSEIEKARRRLPDRIFRQEYLAEFLDDASSVFTNIDACMTLEGHIEPEPGESYVMAWDPARSADYSAVGVRDSKGRMVYRVRWTGKPWTLQIDNIVQLSRKWNFAPIIVDATGIGQALVEALDARGLTVEAVVFTNAVKEQMVNHLAFLIEQAAISFRKDDWTVKGELESYEYTLTSTGNIKYAAPRGKYDDIVTMMMMLFKDYNIAEADMPYMGTLLGAKVGDA